MKSETIANHFARMGARFRIVHQVTSRPDADYALDLRRDRHGQYFEFRVPTSLEPSLEATVLHVAPQDRQLVLLVKEAKWKGRFLCGHDEREWFVAAIPGGTATTVAQAREALKPLTVRQEEARTGLRSRERHRRRNAVSIRQGEWFFVPRPELTVEPSLVLHHEPIRRGQGKPHHVAELYRAGGQLVHVCPRYPNWLSPIAYNRLLAREPEAKTWGWTTMRRNVSVYARGSVRHPDHATVTLPCWHQVLMNTETQSGASANLAFLD